MKCGILVTNQGCYRGGNGMEDLIISGTIVTLVSGFLVGILFTIGVMYALYKVSTRKNDNS
jgi:hypothetical protein